MGVPTALESSFLPRSWAAGRFDFRLLDAITGHNNIFGYGERHGYSESSIGDDAGNHSRTHALI